MILKLTKGFWALIDDEDEWITAWPWHASPQQWTIYARRKVKGKTLYLHRALMDAPPDLEVDHLDGNGLNNQRSNLRLATRRQNAHNVGRPRNNTSGVTGVYWSKSKSKWACTISIDGKQRTLSYHSDFDEAVAARLAAEVEHYGEFHR